MDWFWGSRMKPPPAVTWPNENLNDSMTWIYGGPQDAEEPRHHQDDMKHF